MLKKIITTILFLIPLILSAATSVPYGEISGSWTQVNSPYQIDGATWVPQDSTLTIWPGVEIVFTDFYNLKIFGTLLVLGTETDSVYFYAEDTDEGWRGLRFHNTENGQDSSRIYHCKIENAKATIGGYSDVRGGGIFCNNSSNLLIENCTISNNEANYGGGLGLYNSDILLRNSTISRNKANSDGGGIFCYGDSEPLLEGITVSHNTCNYDGGGIFCSGSSSPLVSNSLILENSTLVGLDGSGGGIFCWGANISIENSIIRSNGDMQNCDYGGGLAIYEGEACLENVMIDHNQAEKGGGIYISWNSSCNLAGVTICHNSCHHNGGGIMFYSDIELTFDETNLCNIFLNKGFDDEDVGNDIAGYSSATPDVILDTFTVLVPTNTQVDPLENFTFDIQHGLVDSVVADLYVSPSGSNTNSGLTPQDPLLSLSLALEMSSPDSLNPLTIHLADGVYSPSSTNEVFPLEVKGYLSIVGNSQTSTILDAEALSPIIFCFSNQNFSLQNITLKNAFNSFWNKAGGLSCIGAADVNITNVSFLSNHSQYDGGGLKVGNSTDVYITNCEFQNNTANAGGGIYVRESSVTYAGVSVFNNTSSGAGGGIYFYECYPDFDPNNLCNIFYNHSSEDDEGNDLAANSANGIQIIVDTFTVLEPGAYYAHPNSSFDFDIQNAKIEPVYADLYVNPEGSNNNTGLTSGEPLQTINFALQKILGDENDPHSIFLANGVYSPSQTGELFPLRCKDYVSIIGESKNLTILDAEQTERVMICATDEVFLQNFTITNGNSGYSDNGGGLYCSWCNPTLDNLKIINNESYEDGGGIYLNHSDAIFLEVTVCHNLAQENGGGIYFKSSEPSFDEDSRSDIYYNEISSHEYFGKDLFVYGNDIVNVFVDTFTVRYANQDYVYPRHQFSMDVEHGKIKQLDQDIYVSPSGSNNNSGLSPDDPFRNISYAMERAVSNELNPHTIHLAAGIYSHDITGEDFPLYVKDNINLKGESRETTILDGSNLSRLIYCESVNNFSIQQMTIQNGNSGSDYGSHGGGLYFSNCDPILNNLKIISNSTTNFSSCGGGICLNNSDATLQEVIICQNNSSKHGGGLYLNNSDPILEEVIVRQNIAHYDGGGIYLEDSNPIFKTTTVSHNCAYANGGGIFFSNSTPIFDQEYLSNIYCNDISSWDYFAKDLYVYNSGTIDVFVDTFTVLFPDNYHLYPPDQFNMNIQNGKIEQIDQDIYISPSGSNSNSGLSSEEPFKNISFAMERIISNESNPHTIHLLAGTYSPNTTGEDFPIYGKSHINFKGESAQTTILDGANLSRLINCNSVDNIKIEQMTIQNGNSENSYNSNDYGGGIRMQASYSAYVFNDSIFVEDVNVINNHSYKGGGIYNEHINLSLDRVIINNNTGYKGGGLYCSGTSFQDTTYVRINKSEICNNVADNTARGFYGSGGKIYISNTTIANNTQGYSPNSAVEFSFADVVLLNTICWNDSLPQIKLIWNGEFTVSHSDIKGGEENIENPNGNVTINWLEGNIDADPLFNDPPSADYSLQENSPCIDGGIPYFEWQGNVILDMQPDEYEGIAPDMGAHEYDDQGVDDPSSLPLVFGMKQNFPNPFAANTNISFSLPAASEVKISVYNIRGQKVKTVADEAFQAGRFSAKWDGTNELSERVGSGIYFYKIEAKAETKTFRKIKKMICIR